MAIKYKSMLNGCVQTLLKNFAMSEDSDMTSHGMSSLPTRASAPRTAASSDGSAGGGGGRSSVIRPCADRRRYLSFAGRKLKRSPPAARKLRDRSTAIVPQPAGMVRQMTHDRGADIAIEAVGNPETWHWAVDMVRRGGTVNFFGGCPNESRVSLDTSLLHYSEITCKASFHHTPAHIRKDARTTAAIKGDGAVE